MKKSFAFLVCFSFLTSTLANTSLALADQFVESSSFSPVFAPFPVEDTETNSETTSEEEEEDYVSLMQDFHDFSESQGEDVFSAEELSDRFGNFIAQEEDFLASVDIPEARKTAYLNRLAEQSSWLQENVSASNATDTPVFGVFGESTSSSVPDTESFFDAPDAEVRFPNSPALFSNETDVPLRSATFEEVPTLFSANALTDASYPVLADIQEDNDDIVFSSEIQSLAEELNYDPLAIYSFLQEHITYEPYYGAKKGAVGCLRDMVCNDIDSASLAIALLRASGIPARYKKSLVLLTAEQMKSILGTEDIKAAYAAFSWGKYPLYTVSGNAIGTDFADADLSGETEFAIEWVWTELFHEYSHAESPGKTTAEIKNATTTEELRSILKQYPQKHWYGFDAVLIPSETIRNEIVHDTAQFDTESFWKSFFSYSGDLSPLEKYISDLQTQTGKDITQSIFQSIRTPLRTSASIIPPTLPFRSVSGRDSKGNSLVPESWSVLPEEKKQSVTIALRKASDNTEIFSFPISATQGGGMPFRLSYQGETQTDKDLIESYGGIFAVPVELVHIVPVLQSESREQSGEIPVSIGDDLLLSFTHFLGSEVLEENEKFSLAGNTEGIFFTLSNISPDAFLDSATDSEILLEGNAALARAYLKKIEEQRQLLEKTFDTEAPVHFARAVVTQQRVLSKTNGVPTTFNFEGLSLDASINMASYSRRGNYDDHRNDFFFLFGQEASYWEGELFHDIAGLEGISTVKGLQYAYAHPSEYTVHTITTANESEIDTLNISENTKINMHADVQAGKTIITPNTFVTNGSFYGLFYVSYSNTTATYAIGEQTPQNGGYTINVLQNGEVVGTYKVEEDGEYFVYADSSGNGDATVCRITKSAYDDVTQISGYDVSQYGIPCFAKESLVFGEVDHTFALATHGAWFQSNAKGYEYWKKKNEIQDILEEDKSNDNLENLQNITLDSTFKFNITAGTYSWFGHYDNKKIITAYYQPSSDNNNRGYGRMVYGEILDKLAKNENVAIKEVGFPLENRKEALESLGGTSGQYQNFVGGQIYQEYDFFGVDDAYVVPDKIADFYNSSENCRIVNNGDPLCGTGGTLGFPVGDSRIEDDILSQEFEEGIIAIDDEEPKILDVSEDGRRLQNKEFTKKILKKVIDGDISDAEAFARIANYISITTENNEQFVRDITLLLVGVEEILSITQYKKIKKELYALQQNKYQWGNNYSTGEVFSDTGFKFEYNDSHYSQKCRSENNSHLYNSNQLFHSMLGLNAGYFWNNWVADLATIAHDIKANPLGEGASIEDINLGFKMGALGSALKNNCIFDCINKNDVGDWIRNNIMDESNSPPKSKNLLEQECNVRKNFRIFEKNTFDNTWGEWEYRKDMYKENNRYYQYYEKFGSYLNIKVLWDDVANQVVLLMN